MQAVPKADVDVLSQSTVPTERWVPSNAMALKPCDEALCAGEGGPASVCEWTRWAGLPLAEKLRWRV